MALLLALKLLLGLLFLGWLMIWFAIPTDMYVNQWLPILRSKTNSTYLGSQGTNILMFTFPIMFIAVLGCIYIHLAKKEGSTRRDGELLNQRFAAWRRPILLKGPLGIVSAIELTFCLMFLTLLVWCITMYLRRSFSLINAEKLAQGEKLWMAELEGAALCLGVVGNIGAAFIFFPVARMSSLLPLVGLTSERSIKYHVWLGHTVMALFVAHAFGYVISWSARSHLSELLKWSAVGPSRLAAVLATVCGLLIWVTSIPGIRRKKFELFFYTHQLYLAFILFYILHIGITSFSTILPGFFLFLVDRCLRFMQSWQKVRLVSARILPTTAVELSFSKSSGLNYTPSSIVFINIPSISLLQWHPFSVSSGSNSEPDKLSVIIKKEGKWTQELYNTLASSLTPDRLAVSVEGPYGPLSVNFLRYESLVLVCGGSGITPFFSIIRELIHRSTTLSLPTPSVLLVCAFKTSVDLQMLHLLLPISGNVLDFSGLDLKIQAYVTREKAPNTQVLNIQTKWFKPSPSEMPISHVLGPNNYLCLGAVIASSFVAFLVLLGIVTRFYIYPIDHNSNSIYNYFHKSLWNFMFICFSIAASVFAAVQWNKKTKRKELKQVHSFVPAAPPPCSPIASFCNSDHRDLEGLPQESIIQCTSVQYGVRPDLKEILLERKDSNTGVMVSGPSRLRSEVASICSSCLGRNLHFESISFTW